MFLLFLRRVIAWFWKHQIALLADWWLVRLTIILLLDFQLLLRWVDNSIDNSLDDSSLIQWRSLLWLKIRFRFSFIYNRNRVLSLHQLLKRIVLLVNVWRVVMDIALYYAILFLHLNWWEVFLSLSILNNLSLRLILSLLHH